MCYGREFETGINPLRIARYEAGRKEGGKTNPAEFGFHLVANITFYFGAAASQAKVLETHPLLTGYKTNTRPLPWQCRGRMSRI